MSLKINPVLLENYIGVMDFRPLKKSEIILIRNKMAKKAVKFFQINYTKQGVKDGGFTRWKDRKKNTGKPILFDTGKMKKSFKIVNKSADTFIIKNTANYSGYHNDGGGDLPKREILYESKELLDELEEVILEQVAKIFGFK